MYEMTREEAIKLLSIFDFEKMSISGKAYYVTKFLDACTIGAEAIKKLQEIEEIIKSNDDEYKYERIKKVMEEKL